MAWKHKKGFNANHHKGHKNTGRAGKSWGHYNRKGKKHAHKGWHGKRRHYQHKKGYHYHLKHKRRASHHRHVTHRSHHRHVTHKAHHKRVIKHHHAVKHHGINIGSAAHRSIHHAKRRRKLSGISIHVGRAVHRSIVHSAPPKARVGHVKVRTLHRKTMNARRAIVAAGGTSHLYPQRHVHSILHRLHRRHHHVQIMHTIHHRQRRVKIHRVHNIVYRKG
jgi:hypothetical protein